MVDRPPALMRLVPQDPGIPAFTFAGVHVCFTCGRPGRRYETIRIAEAWRDALGAEGGPLIVGGDFNLDNLNDDGAAYFWNQVVSDLATASGILTGRSDVVDRTTCGANRLPTTNPPGTGADPNGTDCLGYASSLKQPNEGDPLTLSRLYDHILVFGADDWPESRMPAAHVLDTRVLAGSCDERVNAFGFRRNVSDHLPVMTRVRRNP